jgi:hypothetical protein
VRGSARQLGRDRPGQHLQQGPPERRGADRDVPVAAPGVLRERRPADLADHQPGQPNRGLLPVRRCGAPGHRRPPCRPARRPRPDGHGGQRSSARRRADRGGTGAADCAGVDDLPLRRRDGPGSRLRRWCDAAGRIGVDGSSTARVRAGHLPGRGSPDDRKDRDGAGAPDHVHAGGRVRIRWWENSRTFSDARRRTRRWCTGGAGPSRMRRWTR